MEKVIFTDPDTKEKIEFYVLDRKSVVQGKSVDLGGRRIIKKKKTRTRTRTTKP